MKLKIQSLDDVSRPERMFSILSIVSAACSALLSTFLFMEENQGSSGFTLAIVLSITAVFLLVYPVHGVFWRMPYSLLLHVLCNAACCIVYCTKLNMVIPFLGLAAGVANVPLALYLFRKYWLARTMSFPWGAAYDQDENVKHLFAMSLLLLDLHLELTFMVFVLRIDKTGLAEEEKIKLFLGVTTATSMCVLGFAFLHKTRELLVAGASLCTVYCFVPYNMLIAFQAWKGFQYKGNSALNIAVSIANTALRSFLCVFLFHIHEQFRSSKKRYKPVICSLKSRSPAELSVCEWKFIILTIFTVAGAALLSTLMFMEAKPDSSEFMLAIALGITAVFLLVYPVHGVFWRMSYSLLLHCLCNMVLVACCKVYHTMSNTHPKFKFAILFFGVAVVIANVLLALYLFRKYWKARTMRFPWRAKSYKQDQKVKHLFAMSLLLFEFHLELTFVAFFLNITETGMANSEILKLLEGVTYSTSMCVIGFLFLYTKLESLWFVIQIATLNAGYYFAVNAVDTSQAWTNFHYKGIPARIIMLSFNIACVGPRTFAYVFLYYIYKRSRTKVDTMGYNDSTKHLSDVENDEYTSEEDDTQHKKKHGSSRVKLRRQSLAELMYTILSIVLVVYAAYLSTKLIEEDKTDSAGLPFAIVLYITAAFLLVYTVHGVFWRMPYSLLLQCSCICYIGLMASCRVFYTLPEDTKTKLNIDRPIKNVFMAVGTVIGVLNGLLFQYLVREYWNARKMRFPCGAESHNQDKLVKRLFAMCLLLFDLHLELAFVAFVLKLDKTELANSEIWKMVVGVILSTSMSVLGFLFLYKKWKSLMFLITLASLAEAAYIIYNLVITGEKLEGYPDMVIPAFIFAIGIAIVALRISVCCFLIYTIYRRARTEVACFRSYPDCPCKNIKARKYNEYLNEHQALLGICCTNCGQEWLQKQFLFPPDEDNTRSSVNVHGVVLKQQLKVITESNTSFQEKCSRAEIENVPFVGDHISRLRKASYWHHAIVSEIEIDESINRVQVVEWGKAKGVVKITQKSLDLDKVRKKWNRIDYPADIVHVNTSELVIARARSRLDDTGYGVFSDNCETFASWCKTGRAESSQVHWCFHKLKLIFVTSIVNSGVQEIVKAATAETAHGVLEKASNLVGIGVLALFEIIICAYDLYKIVKSTRHGRRTSVISRLVEALFGISFAAGFGILGEFIGSLLSVCVWPFFGGLIGDFCGGVFGKFLGACICSQTKKEKLQ